MKYPGLGGFVSGRMYKQFSGDRWAWNIVLTATLFAVPLVCVVAYANSVAIYFKVTAALPFLTILEVVSIYALGMSCVLFLYIFCGINPSC